METDPVAQGTPTDPTIGASTSTKAAQLCREIAKGPRSCGCSINDPCTWTRAELLVYFFLPYMLPGLRYSEVLKGLGCSTSWEAGGKFQFWSMPWAFVLVQEDGWGSNCKEVMTAGISVQHKVQCAHSMRMMKSHINYPRSLRDSLEEGDGSERWRSELGLSAGSGCSPSVQLRPWKPPLG